MQKVICSAQLERPFAKNPVYEARYDSDELYAEAWQALQEPTYTVAGVKWLTWMCVRSAQI